MNMSNFPSITESSFKFPLRHFLLLSFHFLPMVLRCSHYDFSYRHVYPLYICVWLKFGHDSHLLNGNWQFLVNGKVIKHFSLTSCTESFNFNIAAYTYCFASEKLSLTECLPLHSYSSYLFPFCCD